MLISYQPGMVPALCDRNFSVDELPSHPPKRGSADAGRAEHPRIAHGEPSAHERLPLQVAFEDDDLLVVVKPAGLLVHRTALDAHESDTVLERLRVQRGGAGAAGLAPVHRLDKGTSGLLVLARHPEAARALGLAFEQGRVEKRYHALVRGWPPAAGDITHPLARDPERPSAGQTRLDARTLVVRRARVEWPFVVDNGHATSRYALVEAQPLTGRRHQIRRHLKHWSHPIIGDATHGKGAHNRAVAQWLGTTRLWLHARELAFDHPRSGARIHLHAPPEAAWQRLQDRGPWVAG